MKSISGKNFAKVLECHGWQLLRINSSHHIYGKSNKPALASPVAVGGLACPFFVALAVESGNELK